MESPTIPDAIFTQDCKEKSLRARTFSQKSKDGCFRYPETSELERGTYYAGLPSRPPLLARSDATTTPWQRPTGFEAYSQRKELRPVGEHALNDGVWETKYAPHVLRLLESEGVLYTSVDVVRIANVPNYRSRPGEIGHIVLWIGVIPQTLDHAKGLAVALKCKEYLEQNGITDVDVELRESVFSRTGGPRFFHSIAGYSPNYVEVARPLTCTLGLGICAENTAWLEGTGGFFMTQDGDSDKILLVTARHVVLPQGIVANDTYEYNVSDDSSQPRRNVLLLGDSGFKELLTSTEKAVRSAYSNIEQHQRQMRSIERERNRGDEEGRGQVAAQAARRDMEKAENAVEKCIAFYQDVFSSWSASENRVIGHVVFSPPLGVRAGDEPYARDFAVIEMDTSRFDAKNFQGNAMDFGMEINDAAGNFLREICPNTTDFEKIKYPIDRLLTLEGTIPQEGIRHPTTLDGRGNPCLIVLKRGTGTGLTVGFSNNIPSFVREYFDGKEPETSMMWAILPRSDKSGPFSESGDSGAVVADNFGRVGGLITGGTAYVESPDITYATPIEFLLKCVCEKFPDARLCVSPGDDDTERTFWE